MTGWVKEKYFNGDPRWRIRHKKEPMRTAISRYTVRFSIASYRLIPKTTGIEEKKASPELVRLRNIYVDKGRVQTSTSVFA
jgi:hypothetical protein